MAISWDGQAWVTLTAYAVNARVVQVGNVYQCSVAGTSGATGPVGTTSPQTDGSVTWLYLGAYAGYFVLGFAPELATGSPTITLTYQTMYLNLAESLVVDTRIWLGPLLDQGRAALAAHYGEMGRLRGHGPITAEAVGALSRGYAALMGKSDLDLTTGGRAYAGLLGVTPAVFGAVL